MFAKQLMNLISYNFVHIQFIIIIIIIIIIINYLFHWAGSFVRS